MTLRYCTSFEQLPGDGNTSGSSAVRGALGWTSTSGNYWDAPTGRRAGTKALGVPQNGAGNADLRFDMPVTFGPTPAQDLYGVGPCTLFLGLAINVPVANPTSYGTTQPTFAFYDNLGNFLGGIYLGGTGGTQVVSSSGASTAGNSTRSFPTTGWHFVEFSLVTGAGSAVLTMWIDGIQIISGPIGGTGVFVNRFTFNAGNNVFYSIDDVYLSDDQGAFNNTLLGDCRVEYLDVTAQGAQQNWQLGGSAGNHFVAVAGSDVSDTGYVRSTGKDVPETYVLADLAVTPTSILGVQVSNIAMSEGGKGHLAGAAKVGATTYEAPVTTIPIKTGYRIAPGIFEKSPASGSAWTLAEVNALEAGPVVVA